jgi:asparagine synthase (glutamine-hydrolysing)
MLLEGQLCTTVDYGKRVVAMTTTSHASASPIYSGRGASYSFFPQFTSIAVQRSDTLAHLARKIDETDFDYDALNVFFRIGTFIGTDTCYRHIKADPPDYELIRSTPHVSSSREQVIDCYIDLVRHAIRCCIGTGDEISLGLSGGRDSRHILLELCGSGRTPAYCWTVDIPFKPSETIVARQLCGRLGIRHKIFHPTGCFAEIEAEKNRLTSFSSLQHAWMAEALLAGIVDTPILFDGIGAADVFTAGVFLSERRLKLLQERRIDELVEDIVGAEDNVPVVRDTGLFTRQRALEKVNDEFRKYLDAADPISSFYFWNRTRRDIGCSAFALVRRHCDKLYTPYLDPDLVRFLSGISPTMTVDHRLHTDTIAKAFRTFADIPYAHGVTQNPDYFRKIGADTLRYLLRNECRMIERKKVSLQLLRASLSAKYAPDALWLGRYVVYLTELSKGLAYS